MNVMSSGQVSGDIVHTQGRTALRWLWEACEHQDILRPAWDILGGSMFKLLSSTQNMGVPWAQTVMSGFPKKGRRISPIASRLLR